jgi:protein-S-isoprenylcysteine O-methyltransferase Ste14
LPSRLRVPLGWLAGAATLAHARPTVRSLAAGLLLALLGESLRLWASGHIEKTQRLATGGPYAHTRNPLYVGSALMAVGVAVATRSWWAAGALSGYFLAFYPSVIVEESRFLARRFGAAYDDWARVVPAFFPRPTPAGPRGSQFSWERVRANREWRTAAALPVVMGLLLARGLLGD